ncbi:MAG: type II secretion system protein [Gallionella sp.]
MRRPSRHTSPNKQRGVALMVMLVVMIMGIAAALIGSLTTTALKNEQQRKTAEALAQAKDALIGYAVKVQLSHSTACIPNCTRPGDLPCPDIDNDGSAESSCGNASGSTGQTTRIGRLPWRTLGLPDLRDGSGERLWYVVSNNFKNNYRTSCTSPGQTGCLNSDTVGTISVSARDGTRINDGSGSTGAVAIIIAPGDILKRQDGLQQDRSSIGINIASNYLDIATVGGNTEDNANFIDGSSSNGFIQGQIDDGNGNTIVNDQLLVISQENIIQPVQKRVAAEVRLCLEDYASNNLGCYPWATPLNDLGTYHDEHDQYFGRLSDNLDNTRSDSYVGGPIFSYTMDNDWGTGACNTHYNNTPSGWWINWKEMVFYGVARRFRPNDTTAPDFPSTCATPGNCLNVNSLNTPAKFVVIVAGKKLGNPDQALRNINKTNAFYYLEGGNENADQSGGYTFIQSSPSATFNDTLIYR